MDLLIIIALKETEGKKFAAQVSIISMLEKTKQRGTTTVKFVGLSSILSFSLSV